MVATASIHGPAGRVTGEAAFESGGLDPLVELEAGIEGLAACAIGDQLDGLEQAAPPDIADVPVIAEALGQPSLEVSAEIPDSFEQFLLADNPLHLERRCAGEGVRHIGMSVLESSRALPDRVDDISTCEHRADRLVAAAESLGDGLDIRGNTLLFPRVKGARAAHAAHYLVENEQSTVPVADVAHGPEVTLRRRHASGGGSDHRLGDECGHRVGAEALEFGL